VKVDVQETATLEMELAEQAWPLIDVVEPHSTAESETETPAALRDTNSSLAP